MHDRKNFVFVGSERAGRAAAIYRSLVESCKVNKVNLLTYLTYVLSLFRDKRGGRSGSIMRPVPPCSGGSRHGGGRDHADVVLGFRETRRASGHPDAAGDRQRCLWRGQLQSRLPATEHPDPRHREHR